MGWSWGLSTGTRHRRPFRTPSSTGLQAGTVNYVHAAVKATVDAYDGTVHLYRTEIGGVDDPILDAWDGIFPGTDRTDAATRTVVAHLQYPTICSPFSRRSSAVTMSTMPSVVQRHRSLGRAPAVSSGVGHGQRHRKVAMLQRRGALAGSWVAQVPFSPGSGATRRPATISPPWRSPITTILGLDAVTLSPAGGRECHAARRPECLRCRPRARPPVHVAQRQRLSGQFGPMTPIVLDDGLVGFDP